MNGAGYPYFSSIPIEPFHDTFYPVGTEYPHEIVFKREEKLARPRITLPAGTAAQLIVYTARLVPFRTQDM